MGPKPNRKPISLAGLVPALVLCGATSGCFGVPDLDSKGVTADATPHAAAIAEMRAEAAAGDKMPYPDVFQSQQTTRLASREEPLSVDEVESIQTELALIAERRATTTDQREIAALEARARELRRLVLRSGSEPVRQ
jgi:hypothetical protein